MVKFPRKPATLSRKPTADKASALKRPSPGLPDEETLLAFLRAAGENSKADIARHFGLKGNDRRELREMLRSLEARGKLGKRGRKGFAEAGSFPPVGVADVVERDSDGELFVCLVNGSDDLGLARLKPLKGAELAHGEPAIGDRLLVHFDRTENGVEAKLIKRLGEGAPRLLGVVRKARREVRVEPISRGVKDSLILLESEGERVKDGDLVFAQIAEENNRRYGPKRGRILEILGQEDDPRAASLIAIAAHDIPVGFSQEAEDEARSALPPSLEGREDLRDLPLITIDPADARDHDDAVYAHADEDPENPGGFVVWVAIADVAAYVRAGTALDREGYRKGNSTYFPDRVEPMLPHALSSNLCSLMEGEPRATLAVRMVFNGHGAKIRHKFVRGLMRSAAKLSYEQAQAAIDGNPDDKSGPLLEPILKPLWAAYACMLKGRLDRQPLAIQTQERKIVLSPDGEVVSITPRVSLTAHQLIEEMMIQANVCAAESLEKARLPLVYRVHDTPSMEKLMNLGEFLATIGIKWSKGEAPRTDRFNALLHETREGPHGEIVNEVVLRTQMQAHYHPDNIGHFGLNLDRYAHFTSPIRRYADLIVHRALIRGLKLGTDGLSDYDMGRLKEMAEHITATERRSMAAERDATDRYIAAFLSAHEGAEFDGKITSVTRFGLFVRLNDTGADGLVPVSHLGDEYFVHDDIQHCLIGERSGKRWRLGMPVRIKLLEATPVTGGLLFEMLSEPLEFDASLPRPRLGLRGRNLPGKRLGRDPKGGGPRGGPKSGKSGSGGQASYGKNTKSKKKR